MKIRARKMTKGSLFKLIFIGFGMPLFPLMLIYGIASLFGAHTVTVNHVPVTGIMGLFSMLLIYPVFCFVFSGMIWVCFALGLWIYSMFGKIELEFVDVDVVDVIPKVDEQRDEDFYRRFTG
ncbi:MAG: hypothetical protein GXP53_13480 [Deltaproteobacteria bacterium]|nr:hypothetical protein [Deltaproteobacteria bacterium]